MGTLKRCRASTTKFIMGNHSMELLVQASRDAKESGLPKLSLLLALCINNL